MATMKHKIFLACLALLDTCLYAAKKNDPEQIFTKIYTHNLWKNDETSSGHGSTLAATANLRKELQELFDRYGIKTINDAPCGDFNWMKKLDFTAYEYRGFDIVKELVEKNNRLFQTPAIHFYTINLINEVLPQADIIICRDTLPHLPFKEALQVIRNFKKSNAKYVLITTYPSTSINEDIKMGYWRLLNLCLPPFNLPQPLELIVEGCTDQPTQYEDKSLGLWRLEDINL